jgi:hypothetical protein
MRPFIAADTIGVGATVAVTMPRGARLKLIAITTDGANAGTVQIGNTNQIPLSNPGAAPESFSLGAEELECFEGPIQIILTGDNADYCILWHEG